MSANSLIEWTDHTWNPVLGCSKCSPGCANCYAIRTAWRLQHNPDPTIAAAYAGLVAQRNDGSLNWTGKINLVTERLLAPLSWREPRRVFVNSQSDLFHSDVPDEFIDQVFAIMALCPQHTFQVLTKRPERMREYFDELDRDTQIAVALGNLLDGDWIWNKGKRFRKRIERTSNRFYGYRADEEEYGAPTEPSPMPLPNVWLGTSVEDQKAAEARIPHLVATPAAVRFLSCEPLLGKLDISRWIGGHRLHWVIAGGESGPAARPMALDWVDDLRAVCEFARVPFFFKQWGEWAPSPDPVEVFNRAAREFKTLPAGTMVRVGKKAAGRLLLGKEWNEMPTPREVAE